MKIRLIGVDAPESRNSRNKVKALFGDEATGYLAGLIDRKRVRLVRYAGTFVELARKARKKNIGLWKASSE